MPQATISRDPIGCRDAIAHGRFIRQPNSDPYPIPAKLNIMLVAVQIVVAFALLGAASHTSHWWQTVLCAVGFAFVMQLGYGLAHEAAHSKLNAKWAINEGLGVLLYTLFPGSFHLFAIAHLVHHQRNRSDAELEDYILPTEKPWLKRGSYYLVLCGLFWVLTPLALLFVSMVPRFFRVPPPEENAGTAARYLQFLNSVNTSRVRRDLLVTACVWTAASLLLHFKLRDLAICYATFAFAWASQQYLYHVHTPRHTVLGALDLRLWRPLELLYLQFNYHLTHHVAAWVPWIYLAEIAPEHPTRGFLSTYIEQWRPPQPVEQAWPREHQNSGPLPAPPEGLL
jgi:fatty acid desaturase